MGEGAVINLPLIDEPWSHVAIDIVGPLDECKVSGNRFLVTMLDLATHFPLAYLVKEHTAVEVAKCLSG